MLNFFRILSILKNLKIFKLTKQFGHIINHWYAIAGNMAVTVALCDLSRTGQVTFSYPWIITAQYVIETVRNIVRNVQGLKTPYKMELFCNLWTKLIEITASTSVLYILIAIAYSSHYIIVGLVSCLIGLIQSCNNLSQRNWKVWSRNRVRVVNCFADWHKISLLFPLLYLQDTF